MPFSWPVDNPARFACTISALYYTDLAQPDNLAVVTRLPSLSRNTRVEDESRFGLKPIVRRRITARGVAPVVLEH